MKITNTVTGGLLVGGWILTIEDATAIFGLIAIIVALVINIIAYFRKKASSKIEDSKNKAEEEAALLEVELLKKQIQKLDEE